MARTLKLRIEDKHGLGIDAIELENMFNSFRRLVSYIPSAGASRERVRIVNVAMNSPLVLEATVEMRTPEDNNDFERGLDTFDSSLRNGEFHGISTVQLGTLRELAQRTLRSRGAITVDIGAVDLVTIDSEIADKIDQEFRGVEYLGAVDGKIEVLNIHDSELTRFNIYPPSDGRIAGQAPKRLEREIQQYFGKYVEVSGTITCRRGESVPHSVRDVTGIRQLGDDISDVSSLFGALADVFAGEPTSEQLVREWRDEGENG